MKRRALAVQVGLGALLLVLVWLALRWVSWREMGALLRSMALRPLLLIIVLDLGVLLLISWRWWLLLRAFGHTLPFARIARYRTTVFGLSYVTPGPQMGGEVLQVYYPTQQHGVSMPVALAAASVDKSMEWLGNLSFMALGGFVVLVGQHVVRRADMLAMLALSVLLLLPVLLLVMVGMGRHPVSSLVGQIGRRLPQRTRRRLRQMPGLRQMPRLERLQMMVGHSEDATARLFRTHPWLLLLAAAMTVLSWVLLYAQFRWMASALHIPLHPGQAAGALALAYLAFLTPMPGGLGAMEAVLVLALTAFGYTAEQALGLALLMRARDVAQAVIGLLLGGLFWRQPTSGRRMHTASTETVAERPPGP